MADNQDYRIETPPADHVVEALRLVFCSLPEAERIAQVKEHLDIQSQNKKPIEEKIRKILLGAYRQDCLVAAALAQTQAGRTAVAWPPRCIERESLETAHSLLQTICGQLDALDVSMVHVLLETVTPDDDTVLSRVGFEPLAKLLYMFCSRDDFPASRPQSSEACTQLDFEPYDSSKHRRLAQIVEQTYEQTLDCPRLNDVRRIDDVLEGYRETGEFSPSRWMIVRHQGKAGAWVGISQIFMEKGKVIR